MNHLVKVQRIHIYPNGNVKVVSESEESYNESRVKAIKKVSKEVGYKYMGRFKDNYGRYYTYYTRKDCKLSTIEYKVMFSVRITNI